MAKQREKDRPDDDRTAYGPGFVGSAIVLCAVLLCGVLLVVTRLAGGAPAPHSAAAAPPAAGGTSATPTSGTTTGGPGRCGVPDGDQGVPIAPPAGAEWVVYRRMVVPGSDAAGPAKVDPDGFRHCWAHSPTGAVFASYNAIAALVESGKLPATVRKLMVPGPDRERLLREPSGESADPGQLVGFRIIDASRDRLSVALALRVPNALASVTLALVWYDGDWRVVPPRPGEEFGAPLTQLQDLGGFVRWGGL